MKNFLNALKYSLATENWYGSLFIALSLPDICGRIEEPSLGSQRRFALWFDKYVAPKYTRKFPKSEPEVVLSGNDCYALRCAYLHEGRDDVSNQRAKEVIDRFVFAAPPPNMFIHMNTRGRQLQLQVNVFCSDIGIGVDQWLEDIQADNDKLQRVADLIQVHTQSDTGRFEVPGLLLIDPE